MESPITTTHFDGFIDSEADGGPTTAEVTSRISAVWARVRKLAPCLTEEYEVEENSGEPIELSADDREILIDTMRSVILRWIDRGSGAIYQEGSGDYSQTLATDRALFRPDEIRDVQSLCPGLRKRSGKAYTAPTWNAEPAPTVHPFLTDTEHV